MAIDAYTGLPGHGKSYGVVEHVIIPSLKQNRLVVTNIPLAIDDLLMDFGGRIEQLPADWFEREDLADFAPPGCVLVLDELWRRWPTCGLHVAFSPGLVAFVIFASMQIKGLLRDNGRYQTSQGVLCDSNVA